MYDGWNLIQELNVPTSGDPTVLRQYTWGLDLSGQSGNSTVGGLHGAGGIGGLLSVYDTNGTTTGEYATSDDKSYVFLYDANGNVGQLVEWADGAGGATGDAWDVDRIVATYEYDPYGNIISQSGTYADTNPIRFSTKFLDPETGLYYYGYRYYSPRLGRWISRDLVIEDVVPARFAFVDNDPLDDADSIGLMSIAIPLPWWGGAIGAGTGVGTRTAPWIGEIGIAGAIPRTMWPHANAGRVRNVLRRIGRIDMPRFRQSRYCRQLGADYKNVCEAVARGFGACTGCDSCGILANKLTGWSRCHEMRLRFRKHCVISGEDTGHLQAINDAAGAHNNCLEFYRTRRCGGRNTRDAIDIELPNVIYTWEWVEVWEPEGTV
ncbi:MAG: hypothetical protein IPM64_10835 [Phycisphaerales bacterium]|nr:hypothetical protein [Phycisphaerales bacterium]